MKKWVGFIVFRPLNCGNKNERSMNDDDDDDNNDNITNFLFHIKKLIWFNIY